MAAEQVDLKKIAAEMSKLSSNMAAIALSSQETKDAVSKVQEKQEQMQQTIDSQQEQLNSQSLYMASQTSQVLAKKDEWQVAFESTDDQNLITEKKCAEMIQHAMHSKIAPVFTAAFNHMSSQHENLEQRFSQLEEEVKSMKIRCAWLEKDLLNSQIEVAKRTIIARNWPDWMTAEDRVLSIRQAIQDAQLDPTLADIYTPEFHREGDEVSIGAVTIITVPNFNWRKILLSHSQSRVKCIYYKKQVKEVEMEGAAEVVINIPKPPEGLQGQELTDWEAAQQEALKNQKKEPVTIRIPTEWRATAKLTPGITQMERRIGAPLHGLMNAYAEAFPCYKGQSLVPRWKTLILTDKQNCWLGRLKYVRCSRTLNTTSQATTDWECIIQLPEEHSNLLKQTWKRLWYSQLYTQIEQTDSEDKALTEMAEKTSTSYKEVQRLTFFMKKAKPAWNEGKEEGMEEWVARFRWEYPWKVSFETLPADHPDRQHFTDLPQVEELMKEMASSTAEMELDSSLTAEEAKDPTGESHRRTGSQKRRESESAAASSQPAHKPRTEKSSAGDRSQSSHSWGSHRGYNTGGWIDYTKMSRGGPYSQAWDSQEQAEDKKEEP